MFVSFFFFQAEDGIRDLVRSRGLGDVYKRQSFGLCICAERVAVDTMVASGEREIRAIAVVTGAPSPTPPGGMCRQVLAEFAQDIPIHLASTVPGTMARTTSLAKLLPDAFRGDMLPSHEGGAS